MEVVWPPALQVRPEVFKEQRRNATQLPSFKLSLWIRDTPVIAGAVQVKLMHHPHRQVLDALARNPSVLPRTQLHLYSRGNPHVRESLAHNSQLIEPLVELLLKEGSERSRTAVALNSRLTPEQRHYLIFEERVARVRGGMSSRPDLSESEIWSLYKRKERPTLIGLGRRKDLPRDIVEEMFRQNDQEELQFLASNLHLDQETRLRLVKTGYQTVVRNLSYVKNIDEETIDAILMSSDHHTHRALSNAESLSVKQMLELLGSPDSQAGVNVVRRSDFPLKHLEQVFRGDYGLMLKRASANSSNLPVSLMLEASKSDDMEMLRELAGNRNLPVEIQKVLAGRGDAKVHRSLGYNKALELSVDLPMGVLRNVHPQPFEELIKEPVDESVWNALMGGWEGSLRDLLEACRLFKRES